MNDIARNRPGGSQLFSNKYFLLSMLAISQTSALLLTDPEISYLNNYYSSLHKFCAAMYLYFSFDIKAITKFSIIKFNINMKQQEWMEPKAVAIPKHSDEWQMGRYGPVLPKTPANYGFTIIANVI